MAIFEILFLWENIYLIDLQPNESDLALFSFISYTPVLDSCSVKALSLLPVVLPKFLLLSHPFVLNVLQTGALQPPAPVGAALPCYSAGLSSTARAALLYYSGDWLNCLTHRQRGFYYFEFYSIYDLQNLFARTYPIAEHYRNCRKGLYSDSYIEEQKSLNMKMQIMILS